LGDPPESARMYRHMAELRIQAESIPDLVLDFPIPGYRSFVKNYPQILDATKRLCAPAGQRAEDIFVSVNEGGWSALDFADEVLSGNAAEVTITEDQRVSYLEQVQALWVEILRDETFPADYKSRIVGLLRKVEEALVDIAVSGTGPVEDAVASVIGVMQTNPSIRDRIAKSKWAQRFIGAIGALLFAFAQDAGHLAIERAFEVDDKPQIVAQQDQNGQHADQPTDQPTPR
jgi:hypothetical protein